MKGKVKKEIRLQKLLNGSKMELTQYVGYQSTCNKRVHYCFDAQNFEAVPVLESLRSRRIWYEYSKNKGTGDSIG